MYNHNANIIKMKSKILFYIYNNKMSETETNEIEEKVIEKLRNKVVKPKSEKQKAHLDKLAKIKKGKKYAEIKEPEIPEIPEVVPEPEVESEPEVVPVKKPKKKAPVKPQKKKVVFYESESSSEEEVIVKKKQPKVKAQEFQKRKSYFNLDIC